MLEAVLTPGSIRHSKLQLNRHHQQTNQHPTFYRPDALTVAQSTLSLSEHWMEHNQ